MTPDLDPPFHDLDFMSPLSRQRADRLTTFLTGAAPGVVADIGCGWAELLIRTLDRSDAFTGTGVDLAADAIAEGRTRAASRGVLDRIDLSVGDGSTAKIPVPTALISVGASQVWRRDSDEHRLPYSSALEGLRSLVDRGARLVYGDGIWSRSPTPAAVDALGGHDDEMVGLATLVSFAESAGFMVAGVSEASLDEWDEFESGYCARYARWIVEHDVDDPDAEQIRETTRRQRERYLNGYRGVLGLAYLQLVAV